MKFCSKCGTQVVDEAVTCPNCGCKVENTMPFAEKEKTNGMAIAGFVCSFFVPLLGWIFGGIGLKRSIELGGRGKGFSIAAIAIATASFVLYLLML